MWVCVCAFSLLRLHRRRTLLSHLLASLHVFAFVVLCLRVSFRFFGVIYFIWLSSTRRIECENIVSASYGTIRMSVCSASFTWLPSYRLLLPHRYRCCSCRCHCHYVLMCVVHFALAGDCITCCYRFVFMLAARSTKPNTLFTSRRQASGATDENYEQDI